MIRFLQSSFILASILLSTSSLVIAQNESQENTDSRTPQEILDNPPDVIEHIGLSEHLSPTRQNGLAALVTAIKTSAQRQSGAAMSAWMLARPDALNYTATVFAYKR